MVVALVLNSFVNLLAEVEEHQRMALRYLQIDNMFVAFGIEVEDLDHEFDLGFGELLFPADFLLLLLLIAHF